MAYRLLDVGVLNLDTGATVLPGTPAWSDYLAYLNAGGVVEPAIVPAPPAPTQAELDALAELQTRRTIRAALASDPAVKALMTWTPDQANAWIDANVVDLASAKTALKIVARVLALLARERI